MLERVTTRSWLSEGVRPTTVIMTFPIEPLLFDFKFTTKYDNLSTDLKNSVDIDDDNTTTTVEDKQSHHVWTSIFAGFSHKLKRLKKDINALFRLILHIGTSRFSVKAITTLCLSSTVYPLVWKFINFACHC